MKQEIRQLIETALATLVQDTDLAVPDGFSPQIERTRERAHGDFACNAPLALAKPARQAPRQIAQALIERLPTSPLIRQVEIAGPGFINFFLAPAAYHELIGEILEQGEQYGHSSLGQGQRVLLEFVSANPTGPLHIGHGRGAAYGATLANLLRATGHDVDCEYFVNDAGRQMDILTCSVWLRYLQADDATLEFPDNAYRGEYVIDIARELRNRCMDSLARVTMQLPRANAYADAERYLDKLIDSARSLLGEDDWRQLQDFALQAILADIRADLAEFGVEFDRWFSERSLVQSGHIEQAIARLRAAGHLYEAEGAVWFRATAFGDEKDRVIVRENGQTTYFAADIAYHMDKLERGYHTLVDIWGADHHGYAPRVRAALQARGGDPGQLVILFVQFATLYRGTERLPMSTRAGEFVTLRELRDEVGRDAARFFYIMRRSDQHLEFDLELAKSQSSDNPVYYIQYAHARICSLLRQLHERGLQHNHTRGLASLAELNTSHEEQLMVTLSRYSEVIEVAATAREPHQLAYYLRDLANEFHVYYNAQQFLVDTPSLRDARLSLALATRQVLYNGLGLLGVSAPESM